MLWRNSSSFVHIRLWSSLMPLSLKTESFTNALIKPCMARTIVIACKIHCILSHCEGHRHSQLEKHSKVMQALIPFKLSVSGISKCVVRTLHLECQSFSLMEHQNGWHLKRLSRTAALHVLHSVIDTHQFRSSCLRPVHAELPCTVSLCPVKATRKASHRGREIRGTLGRESPAYK